MHTLPDLLQDLAIMLGVAGLVVLLFQKTRQPLVLGYLVAGMLIGPYLTPLKLITDLDNIKTLSELGVIFLMFSLGLEFSFQKLTKLGAASLVTGVFDVLLMLALGYSAGLILGWNFENCLFLGASIAISSTTIIVKTINELNIKTKRFAEVIFGVLIVEDLMAILLLVALSTIAVNNTVSALSIVTAIVKLLLVVGSWFLIGYLLVPAMFRRVVHYISQETLTIIAVALCLFSAALATYFHYSSALGSFIMGSILAETILVSRIEEVIIPLRDIFGALFFISVGMLINPTLIMEQLPQVIFLSLVLVFGKVIVISMLNLLTGQSISTSIRAGFGMAQIGEFSFIIASLGSSLNVINADFYPIIVAVSSITTFTTPYMLRISGSISKKIELILPERFKLFLENYASWVYRAQAKKQRHNLLQPFTPRLLINGIIVAVIFSLTNKLLLNQLANLIHNTKYAKMFCEIIAMLISFPFIWGMIFSYKSKISNSDEPKKFSPAILLVTLITVIEIIFLSILYFHTWMTTVIFIIVLALSFVIAYRQIGDSYRWFETQLMRNIKTKSAKFSKYKELAPWDTHIVEISVGSCSEFVAKSLGACKIRERFGVNVVALQRGHHTILSPRGDKIIYDDDKLIVLGTDEQLDKLRQKMEVFSLHKEQEIRLESFILKPLLISANSSLTAKTIRNSMIREQTNGLVIGLERAGKRILNPSSDLVLQENDLLLVVGTDEELNKFLATSNTSAFD